MSPSDFSLPLSDFFSPVFPSLFASISLPLTFSLTLSPALPISLPLSLSPSLYPLSSFPFLFNFSLSSLSSRPSLPPYPLLFSSLSLLSSLLSLPSFSPSLSFLSLLLFLFLSEREREEGCWGDRGEGAHREGETGRDGGVREKSVEQAQTVGEEGIEFLLKSGLSPQIQRETDRQRESARARKRKSLLGTRLHPH